jgi:DNA polymerase elongation subunit (family B)
MNSFYGVSSNNYWRLAKDGLGDAITSASRYALFKGKQIVERSGYEVLAGDTDSCFFSLAREEEPLDMKQRAVLDGKGLTNQVNTGMEEAIRESGLEGDHPYLTGMLPHEADAHCLSYEFEKLYRRYIQFGKKKRYAGLLTWKEGEDVDKVDVTGFEAKRSDTPELAAEAQTEVLHMVLGGADFEAVSEYVSGLCEAIKTESVPLARIARPKSLGKELDAYDAVTQAVKACRASTAQLGKDWRKGDDPFLVFLEETPPMQPAVSTIALEWGDDLPGGYTIDAEEHIRICLEGPLEPILDELGWRWKEIKTGATVGNALDGGWDTAADSDGTDDDHSNSGEERRGEDEQITRLRRDGDDGSPERCKGEDDDDDSADSSGGALEGDW